LAHRAWQLQPDNPEDISTLARAWLVLGGLDEAEELVQKGLETSGQNANLQNVYWQLLLLTGRLEEAQSLVQNMMAEFGGEVPAGLQSNFDLQLGMIAALKADYQLAYEYFNRAISNEDNPAYSGNEILVFTMASLMSRQAGKPDEAQARLTEAERKVKRARLNGVDDPGIYYTEAIIWTMRDDQEKALQKLNLAYEHGFREQWLLEIDGRLDPLRQQTAFIELKNRLEDELTRALAEVRSNSMALL